MRFKLKPASHFMQSRPIQYSFKTFQVLFYANQGLFQEETAQPSMSVIPRNSICVILLVGFRVPVYFNNLKVIANRLTETTLKEKFTIKT